MCPNQGLYKDFTGPFPCRGSYFEIYVFQISTNINIDKTSKWLSYSNNFAPENGLKVEELFQDGLRLESFLVNATSDSINPDYIPRFFDAPLNIGSILSYLIRTSATGSTGLE